MLRCLLDATEDVQFKNKETTERKPGSQNNEDNETTKGTSCLSTKNNKKTVTLL